MFSVQAQENYEQDVNSRIEYAINYGKDAGFISIGDVLILVCGWKKGSGFTNTLRIIYTA